MADDKQKGVNQGGYGGQPALFNAERSKLIESFRMCVLESEALQAELREADTDEKVLRVAAKNGFRISEIGKSTSGAGLGEADLQAVLAAAPCWCDPSVVNTKSC